MSSIKPRLCIICHQVVKLENVKMKADELKRLLRICYKHLTPILHETLQSPDDIDNVNDCDLIMCHSCLEGLRENAKIATDLEKCEAMMANSSIKFNISTLKRRVNTDGGGNASASASHQNAGPILVPKKEEVGSPGGNTDDDGDILPADITEFVLQYLPELPDEEDIETLGALVADEEPVSAEELLQNIGDQLTPFGKEPLKIETVEVKTEENAFSNPLALAEENINMTAVSIGTKNTIITEGLVVNPLANIMTTNLKVEDGFPENQEPMENEIVEISSVIKYEYQPPSIVTKTDETAISIQERRLRTSPRLLEKNKPVKVEESVAKTKPTFDRTRLRPRDRGVSYFHVANTFQNDSKDSVKQKLRKLDNKSGRVCKGDKKSKFCCSLCNRILTSKQGLESHKRIHTGEKPYRCFICNKCYVSKSGLKYHEKRCPQIW